MPVAIEEMDTRHFGHLFDKATESYFPSDSINFREIPERFFDPMGAFLNRYKADSETKKLRAQGIDVPHNKNVQDQNLRYEYFSIRMMQPVKTKRCFGLISFPLMDSVYPVFIVSNSDFVPKPITVAKRSLWEYFLFDFKFRWLLSKKKDISDFPSFFAIWSHSGFSSPCRTIEIYIQRLVKHPVVFQFPIFHAFFYSRDSNWGDYDNSEDDDTYVVPIITNQSERRVYSTRTLFRFCELAAQGGEMGVDPLRDRVPASFWEGEESRPEDILDPRFLPTIDNNIATPLDMKALYGSKANTASNTNLTAASVRSREDSQLLARSFVHFGSVETVVQTPRGPRVLHQPNFPSLLLAAQEAKERGRFAKSFSAASNVNGGGMLPKNGSSASLLEDRGVTLQSWVLSSSLPNRENSFHRQLNGLRKNSDEGVSEETRIIDLDSPPLTAAGAAALCEKVTSSPFLNVTNNASRQRHLSAIDEEVPVPQHMKSVFSYEEKYEDENGEVGEDDNGLYMK